MHKRGPDHPNIFGQPDSKETGKDDTPYGNESVVWTTGSGIRGEREKERVGSGPVYAKEMKDEFFEASDVFRGRVEGKVFKTGAKGVGYYMNG